MSVFDQDDDQNKDYLAELTGPGGKFDRTKYASDQEMYQAIAKGKYLGDRTLDFKNREFDELRDTLIAKTAEADTAAKLDELIRKYDERALNKDTTNNPNVGDVLPPVIDEAKIEATVEAKIRAIESGKTEKANLDIFDQRLRDAHGENAGSILRDKMNTLGISPEDLKALAKKSPEAALNTLGLSKRTEGFQPVPRSSIRTDNFKPEATIRDAVYWEKMRNENMKEYFSQKNSVQRLEDMEHPDFLKRLNERKGL